MRLLPAVPAAILATGLLAIGYLRGPTLDASVFAVIASELRNGVIPYRDLFDHKPPGIYIIEAASGSLLPFLDGWSNAWLTSVLATVLTLVLLTLGTARSVGAWATTAGLLSVGPVLGAHLFALGGGYTEPVAILPATVGVLLVARSGRLPGFWGGLSLGVAAAVSLQVVPAALAVVIVQCIARRPVDALATLAGMAVVGACVSAWLWGVGALPSAIDALVTYNRAYVERNDLLDPVPLTAMARAGLIASPAVGATAVRMISWRRVRPGFVETIAGTWLVGFLLYVVMQGNFFPHYLIAAVPALAILSSAGVRVLLLSASTPTGRLGAAFVIGLAAIPALLGVAATEPPARRPVAIDEAAYVVRQATASDARLLVWGNEPELYLATGRRPATRYVYLLPLIQPGYAGGELIGDLLNDLRSRPPDVVVDASFNPERVGFVPLIEPSRYPPGLIDDLGLLDPIRDWVQSRYRRLTTSGEWPIYVLKR